MAVPKFFEFFPVVLQSLLDGSEKSVKQIRMDSIKFLPVTEEDCNELLPSGRQRTVDNRVNWAITYLKNAGLISAVRRGNYIITNEGISAYRDAGSNIDLNYLERYDSFRTFHCSTVNKQARKYLHSQPSRIRRKICSKRPTLKSIAPLLKIYLLPLWNIALPFLNDLLLIYY